MPYQVGRVQGSRVLELVTRYGLKDALDIISDRAKYGNRRDIIAISKAYHDSAVRMRLSHFEAFLAKHGVEKAQQIINERLKTRVTFK